MQRRACFDTLRRLGNATRRDCLLEAVHVEDSIPIKRAIKGRTNIEYFFPISFFGCAAAEDKETV